MDKIKSAQERHGGFAIAGTDVQIQLYLAEIAELRAALASSATTEQPVQQLDRLPWYCPHCQTGVPNQNVTFHEYHDPAAGGCGYRVGDWPEVPAPSDLSKAILALPLPKDGAAWVTPLRYGSKVSFPKPPKPEGWDDDEEKWFCRPLFSEDQVRALLSAAAALAKQVPAQEQDKWISVKDRLPDIGTPVWLYEEGRGAWVGGPWGRW
jgi:hypothetical protein